MFKYLIVASKVTLKAIGAASVDSKLIWNYVP